MPKTYYKPVCDYLYNMCWIMFVFFTSKLDYIIYTLQFGEYVSIKILGMKCRFQKDMVIKFD